MKKILAIVPMLTVLGGLLLNSSNVLNEQPKQAASEQPIVFSSSDPGGW